MASTNPGNFANRPKEEVQAIAAKGGKASHGGIEALLNEKGIDPVTGEKKDDDSGSGKQGFASMDPEKQREIASMGGKASSGSFEPGSWKAKEAGHKGGLASGGGSS